MAEVLGIAAAILQIVELTTSVAWKTRTLARKLKHAPRRIISHLHAVEALNRIICALNSALERTDSPCIRDVLSNESQVTVKELLDHCEEKVKSCDTILNSVLPKDESTWKNAWKRFASVKKEEEIKEELRCPELLRSELSIWYSHQIMLVTCQSSLHMITLDSRLQSLQEQVLRQTSGRVLPNVDESGFEETDHRIDQRKEPGALVPRSTLPINTLAEEICNRLTSKSGLLAEAARDAFDSEKHAHGSCPCKRVLKQTFSLNFWLVHYQQRTVERHKPACPYFERSIEQRMESNLRVSLLSRSFKMTLERSTGSGALMLLKLQTYPVVEGRTALSFNRIGQAFLNVDKILYRNRFGSRWLVGGCITDDMSLEVRHVMEEYYETLFEDLRTAQYSARQQTEGGTTLLHHYSVVLSYIWFYQLELRHVIEKTVTLLVEFGVDVNATTSKYTALSHYLELVEDHDFVRMGWDASIPRILSQVSTDAFSGIKPKVGYASLFPKMPELAIEYGCSKLSMAVIERDQVEFERLIRNNYSVNDTLAPPFSPLCFAMGWDQGVDVLLKAGADPSDAIHCAIYCGDQSNLRKLLHRGCRLFALPDPSQITGLWSYNAFSGSALSFALWCERERGATSPAIIGSIVQAIADSRHKLMHMAREYLSIAKLKHFDSNCLSNEVLVSDGVATMLLKSLLELGITVPETLVPSRMRSIHHEEWMTATAADLLFEAGFKEVDILDDTGRTPLLLNIHFSRHDLQERSACWDSFLRHGARVVFPEVNGTSLAHFIAAGLGHLWSTVPNQGDESYRWYQALNRKLTQKAEKCLPPLLDRIFGFLSSSQRDGCRCFCSECGCLPVHALLKHMWNAWDTPGGLWSTWRDEQKLLDVWRKCTAANQLRELEYSEVCRFQVFNGLGMRHTCCPPFRYWPQGRFPQIRIMDDAERQEIQQEDAYTKCQLGAFMMLYHELSTKHELRFTEFWDIWWDVLEEYLPSVNWGKYCGDLRHVQIHDELVPIEDHELQPRLDQIKDQVTRAMDSGSQH